MRAESSVVSVGLAMQWVATWDSDINMPDSGVQNQIRLDKR